MFDIKIATTTGEVIPLDRVCYTCLDGGAVLPEGKLNSEGKCSTCRGKGHVLTGNGLRVLELLNRYKEFIL